MNAFPLSTKPTAPRRPLEGIVVAVVVVLSIWLVVAAGLQRDAMRDGTVPGPLPEVPSIVQAELQAPGIEVGPAPLPGPDIAPVGGGVSPR